MLGNLSLVPIGLSGPLTEQAPAGPAAAPLPPAGEDDWQILVSLSQII